MTVLINVVLIILSLILTYNQVEDKLIIFSLSVGVIGLLVGIYLLKRFKGK